MTSKHLPHNGLDLTLAHVESDLDILDRHDPELFAVEHEILADMKRGDHEYKDAHLHSIPKPIKHRGPTGRMH